MQASELNHTLAESVLQPGTKVFVPYIVTKSPSGEIRFYEANVPHNVFSGFTMDEVMGWLMPGFKKEIAQKEGVNVSEVRLLSGADLSAADEEKIRARWRGKK
jgi:hypothetical protein